MGRAGRLWLGRSLGRATRGRLHPGRILGPTLSLRFRRGLGLSRAQVGAAGEALVARALRQAGARVCGRRVQSQWAEVDLVAYLGDSLVLVEVKTASPRSRPEAPLASARSPSPDGSSPAPHAEPRTASQGLALVPPWNRRPARGLGPRQRERLHRAGRAARRSWGGPVRVLLAEVLLDHGHEQEPALHWTELLFLPGA